MIKPPSHIPCVDYNIIHLHHVPAALSGDVGFVEIRQDAVDNYGVFPLLLHCELLYVPVNLRFKLFLHTV